MLTALTRLLYRTARLANCARIFQQLLRGNAKPLLRHERNRLYFDFSAAF